MVELQKRAKATMRCHYNSIINYNGEFDCPAVPKNIKLRVVDGPYLMSLQTHRVMPHLHTKKLALQLIKISMCMQVCVVRIIQVLR